MKEKILERIFQLSSSSGPRWGRMTVSQMLTHLHAQISVALGEKHLKPNFLGKVFARLLKRQLLTQKPYGKNLPTAREFIIKNDLHFEEARNILIEAVKKFDASSITRNPHPYFGKMTMDEWSVATWKHFDHHLKQFGV